jgi:UPF0755 protein
MRKIVGFVIPALILLITIIWWIHGTSAVNPKNTNTKYFVVPKGAGIRAIASNLKKEGLINDPVVFFLYVKKEGADKKIQAGDYKLSQSMDLKKITSELIHGTVDAWVTIPEGYRAEQIADTLEQIIPSYNPSWRTRLVEKEGYLFPDTYLIPRDASIETALSIFETNFNNKINDLGISERNDLNRIIIIASMIEREALFHNERPTVASVIYNRLGLGMKLDIDATVQYAIGKRNGKWWYPITPNDLRFDSIYNTYTNNGLPPGPISNPGLDSIRAAANPADTNYLYYITDSKGHLHGAATFQQHQANINKYL